MTARHLPTTTAPNGRSLIAPTKMWPTFSQKNMREAFASLISLVRVFITDLTKTSKSPAKTHIFLCPHFFSPGFCKYLLIAIQKYCYQRSIMMFDKVALPASCLIASTRYMSIRPAQSLRTCKLPEQGMYKPPTFHKILNGHRFRFACT